MDKQYALLNELNQSKQDWKIMVRIERLWNILQLGKNTISGLDLIVMDEKGTQMHAKILLRDISRFKEDLHENKVVFLENFIVQNKDTLYCPLENPLKIKFKSATKVYPGDNLMHFPKPTFIFTEFDHLQQKIEKNDPLTDVIGIFVKVDKEDVIITTKAGDSPKRDLYIANESGREMKITFWGKSIELLPTTITTSNNEKTILIITSTVVKKYSTTYLQATFATKIYVNMDIPETFALKNRSSKPTPKRSFPQHNVSQISEMEALITEATRPFSILCQGTITVVHTNEGFCYNACTTCTKGVTKRGPSYWCYKCRETIEEPEIRLRIQFRIEDETGTKDITAFEEQAETLLGKQLDDMLNLSLEENKNTLVNQALEKIIGKKYIFVIRISDFNLQHPESPPTTTKIFETTEHQQKKAKHT